MPLLDALIYPQAMVTLPLQDAVGLVCPDTRTLPVRGHHTAWQAIQLLC